MPEPSRPQAVGRAILAGYVDAAARMAGCRLTATITLELNGLSFPGNAEGIRYSIVKAAAIDPASPAAVLAGVVDG